MLFPTKLNTRGWVFEAEVLQKLLIQLHTQHFGSERLTPVMGLPNEKVLLFRHAWEYYYIWNRDSIYRVDLPQGLDEIIDTLMEQGVSSNPNLKLIHIENA